MADTLALYTSSTALTGGGPRLVLSTATFHASPGFGSRSRRFERNKMFLPHPHVKLSIVGSLRYREVACSASDHQGSIFESCVWRTVSSHSSNHPQDVLLAQFSLYVDKGGLKPDSFHFTTALMCQSWRYPALILCYIFILGSLHIPQYT